MTGVERTMFYPEIVSHNFLAFRVPEDLTFAEFRPTDMIQVTVSMKASPVVFGFLPRTNTVEEILHMGRQFST